MSMLKKEIATIAEQINAKIKEYNESLKKNDLKKVSKAESELRELEKEYSSAMMAQVCDEIAEKSEKTGENPVKLAIEKYQYEVLSHKANRDDNGAIESIEMAYRMRQIDLVKFCKRCRLDTSWQYSVESFNQLLALRVATELKLSKKKILEICNSFNMNKLAERAEAGDTPASTTQICKKLQAIIDKVLYEDNGKGKNTYSANSHDVAYILHTYCKRSSKKALSVAVAKNSFMHTLLVDVMHRIVTGKVYDLEYAMVKNSEQPAEKTNKEKAVEVKDADTIVVEKGEKSE